MLDFEQCRNKIQEMPEAIKGRLKIPAMARRWSLMNLTLAAGLLVSACSIRGNDKQYFLEGMSNRLEDKQLEQSDGPIRRVSFWLDRAYSADGSFSGSLALEVCLKDKGTMMLVSQQISGEPGPGFLFAGQYEFDNNCVTSKDGRPLHPVTDVSDPERDAIYIGTNGLENMRAYSINRDSRMSSGSRNANGLSGVMVGITTLQSPIVSRDGNQLHP